MIEEAIEEIEMMAIPTTTIGLETKEMMTVEEEEILEIVVGDQYQNQDHRFQNPIEDQFQGRDQGQFQPQMAYHLS